jgi:hypothetical protein
MQPLGRYLLKKRSRTSTMVEAQKILIPYLNYWRPALLKFPLFPTTLFDDLDAQFIYQNKERYRMHSHLIKVNISIFSWQQKFSALPLIGDWKLFVGNYKHLKQCSYNSTNKTIPVIYLFFYLRALVPLKALINSLLAYTLQ